MLSSLARSSRSAQAERSESGATHFMCGWARLRDAAISSGAGNDEAKPNGAFAPGLWLWFLTLTFVLGIRAAQAVPL